MTSFSSVPACDTPTFTTSDRRSPAWSIASRDTSARLSFACSMLLSKKAISGGLGSGAGADAPFLAACQFDEIVLVTIDQQQRDHQYGDRHVAPTHQQPR